LQVQGFQDHHPSVLDSPLSINQICIYLKQFYPSQEMYKVASVPVLYCSLKKSQGWRGNFSVSECNSSVEDNGNSPMSHIIWKRVNLLSINMEFQ